MACRKISFFSAIALVVLTGLFQSSFAASVTYTMQTGNFNSLQTVRNNIPPYAGTYNNGATELANYANGGSFGNTPGAAAFQTFTITGNGNTGSVRALQVGDTFTITAFTSANPSVGGYLGISFRDSTTYTSFANATDNTTEARFQLDNTGGWKVYNSGTATDSGQGSGADRTFVIKITSSTTFDAQVAGTWYRNFTMAAGGGTIDSFAIYTFGDSNQNSFWKNATLADTGTVELGYAAGNNTTFDPGVVSDGLAANSTSSTVANAVFIGGDSGSAVLLNEQNTYTGATTVNANATARASHANSFGTTAGGVSVTSGGRIETSGGITIGAEALTLNGTGISSSGALRNTAGNNIWQGNITLGSASSIASDAGTLTLSGTVTHGGNRLTVLGNSSVTISGNMSGTGSSDLLKQGSGALTLSGDNSGLNPSGANSMFIDQGTVYLNNNNAAGAKAIDLGSGVSGSGSAALYAIGGRTIGNAITVQGDNTTTLTIGSDSTADDNTFTGNIVLEKTANFNAGTGRNVTFSTGVISGSGGVTKTGSGTLTLSSDTSNFGTLTVNAGSVAINGNTTVTGLASGAGGAMTITSGKTLTVNSSSADSTFARNITGDGGLTKSGNFILNLTGSGNTYTGATTINGGMLTLSASNSAGGSTAAISLGNAFLGFNGNFELGSGRAITLTAAGSGLDVYGGNTATFNGNIGESGDARTLTKRGDGTLVLGGSGSTFSGATTISNGVLRMADANALGSGSVTVSSGTALQLSNNISVGSKAISLNGSGFNNADGAVRNISGNNSWAGNITLAGNARINTDAGSLSLSGTVAAGANTLYVGGGNATTSLSNALSGNKTTGDGALYKDGTGTLALLGNNTGLSGHTLIRQGAIIISNNNALGSGGTTFIGDTSGANTATLRLGSGVNNNNAINVVGGGTGVRTLDYQNASGTGQQSGNIALNNSLAFNVLTSGTMLFSGTVTPTNSGNVRLALDGGGTLISTGNSTTTANNYQIRVGNGTLIIGAGALTARTGAAGIGHGYDLGVDLNNTAVNATSSILASNGVSVVSSIYVSTAGTAARVLGLTGSGEATFSGAVDLNNAGLTVTADNAGGNAVFSGAIGNFSGSTAANNTLTKTGAGTVTLSGANSYGGATMIAGGTLRIDGNSRLGNTSATMTISNAGVLQVTATGTITNAITVGDGNGVLSNSSGGQVVFAGGASKDGTVLTSRSGSGTNVFSGVISGASANSDFVVDGGTTIFSNVMTYNGPTIITNGGTLVLGVDDAMPSGSNLILGGGTFRVGVLNYNSDASLSMGTLTLTENSTIDFGDYGSTGDRILKFSDSSAITWVSGKTLTITNWQGVARTSSEVTQLLFGTGGLSSASLGQIYFANQNIDGGMIIGLNNELVPVPEPRVYAATVALLFAIGWRERKRLRSLLGGLARRG